MTEGEERRKTASVYWRTPEERETYQKLKIGAKAFDMSFSDLAKETLSDPWWWLKHPLLLVRFAWEGVWGPYDKLDTMVKILGGLPDRDQIETEGRKMSCDELLTGLKTHKEVKRLLDIYEEVWSELYREGMKRQHGVDVDEIRI